MKHRAGRRCAGPVAVLAAIVLVTACGRGSQPQPVSAGAPAPAPAAAPAPGDPSSLPTLPPIEQRVPEAFDGNGCLRGASGDCSSSAAQIDQAAGQAAPDGSRTLAGFIGPHWSTDAPSGLLTVLESTVTMSATAEGNWSAVGLVRNDHAEVVPGLTVVAELVAADGTVVESVRGDALVRSVRSGEPAPFVLSSKATKWAAVASVRWSAAAATGIADSNARSLELQTFWVRPPTDPRRVDNELHHDPASGPLPLLVSGSATNRGTGTVTKPHVVAAWLDGGGRVVLVRDVPLRTSAGDPATALDATQFNDFLVDVDASAAGNVPSEQLETPMLWGAGA